MAYPWGNREKIRPPPRVEYIWSSDLGRSSVVWCLACSTVDREVGCSNLPCARALWLSCQWSMTGHINNPVPLIEKSRASCPSGSFTVGSIHPSMSSMWWVGDPIIKWNCQAEGGGRPPPQIQDVGNGGGGGAHPSIQVKHVVGGWPNNEIKLSGWRGGRPPPPPDPPL